MATFAPVRTIFPDTKISSTILGCFIRYISPGNSSGSYFKIEVDSIRKVVQKNM